MRIALDTNRYSDLVAGDAVTLATLEGVEHVFLAFIVVAELRAGFLGGSRRRSNEQLLIDFLALPHVSVLYADDSTTSIWASLKHELSLKGRAIPVNDLWIAALVLQHGLTLCSRDAHFDHLPQIPRV